MLLADEREEYCKLTNSGTDYTFILSPLLPPIFQCANMEGKGLGGLVMMSCDIRDRWGALSLGIEIFKYRLRAWEQGKGTSNGQAADLADFNRLKW